MQNRTSDDGKKERQCKHRGCRRRAVPEWTVREERIWSRGRKTRRTRKGCAAPDQARRAETETDDGRLRGSFWWGGREIDGGRREQNRSSLHVSKGQPMPQYVLARCLQTGCTFRRKWSRLCFDGAVGSKRSDRQLAAVEVAVVVLAVVTLASGRQGHTGQASQSVGKSRLKGRIRVDKARPWILDEGQIPADGRAALTDLGPEMDVGNGRSGNGEEWGGSRDWVQRVPLGRTDAEEELEGVTGRSRRCG